jgi:hypothetical protein
MKGPVHCRRDLMVTECHAKTPRVGRGRLAMRGAMSGGAADANALSGALNPLTVPVASSKRVATVWTTERDSESGSDVPVITYGVEKRDNVHENRSFRGGLRASVLRTPPSRLSLNERAGAARAGPPRAASNKSKARALSQYKRSE